MNLAKNKKILVFGLGLSGQALVKKLSRLGARVIATDSQKAAALNLKSLKKLKAKFFLGSHPTTVLYDLDLIVLSPGVPGDLPILKKAQKKGIPIIGEIELAYRLLKKPIIAVTGTNGKSTTTTLIGEILKKAGFKIAVAGNIGYPLIKVTDKNLDYIVAEVSSYQLESIVNFKPFISVILNITPDHLSRHKNMKNYLKAKQRVFENQTQKDFLIYNVLDKNILKIIKSARAQKIPFRVGGILKSGLFVKQGQIFAEIFGQKLPLISVKDIPLVGSHNVANVLAAAAVALVLGVRPEVIKKAIKAFQGLEHRLELVREIGSVKFYNDSKATNPDSTVIALRALSAYSPKRIILIAGGRDKGTSLRELSCEIKKRVKTLILLGEAAPRFEAYFRQRGIRAIYRVGSFAQAVKLSYVLSDDSDIVLLSPASASFDMFRNFEERGRVFKNLVLSLKEK